MRHVVGHLKGKVTSLLLAWSWVLLTYTFKDFQGFDLSLEKLITQFTGLGIHRRRWIAIRFGTSIFVWALIFNFLRRHVLSRIFVAFKPGRN